MKACFILALVILGHVCQIQAATLSKPPSKITDDATKQLAEKIYHSLMEHREDLAEAFKALKSSANSLGDETDEQAISAMVMAIITAIVSSSVSAAVGAGVQAAINKG